jgi:hypothetical protein
VRDGTSVFLLGVASRATGITDSGLCESGAIYTSAAAHADWIYEKVPEALPGGGAAGRCSIGSMSSRPSPFIVVVALVAFFLLFGRRSRSTNAVALALVAGLLGCAGSDASDAGENLCSEAYDPLGIYCDSQTARIDLQAAERIARDAVPEDAWFWAAFAIEETGMNPDGEAETWELEYYVPELLDPPEGQLLSVTVQGSGAHEVIDSATRLRCIPSRPISALDSRTIAHDAIRRLQSEGITVELGRVKTLNLYQGHRCGTVTDGWNAVVYDTSLVLYDEAGHQLGYYAYRPDPDFMPGP